jgi:hypothetical protein
MRSTHLQSHCQYRCRHVCFHSWVAGVWNPATLLCRLTINIIFLLQLLRSGINIYVNNNYTELSRSQWPRGLRHEMSSRARTLGSWVRIPFKVWLSLCISLCLCVGSGLATSWSPVQGVLQTVLDYETEAKKSVSRMPYAPSGSNRIRWRRIRKTRRHRIEYFTARKG